MEESSIGASDIRSRLDQLSQSWDELKNMAANRLDGMLCVCVCVHAHGRTCVCVGVWGGVGGGGGGGEIFPFLSIVKLL